MYKSIIPVVCLLWLAACGGGGGGSSDPQGSNNNPNNPPSSSQNTGAGLFQQLDDALAQRTVSETDPSGLWVFYGMGTNNTLSTLSGSSSQLDDTVNLYAVLVSVFVVDNSGTPEIRFGECTAGYTLNASTAAMALTPPNSFTQVSMNLNQLVRLGSAGYPFHPGDILLDSAYQNFLDSDFVVTISNNREMTFLTSFTYSDDQGDIQGDFSATFKARKLSDNFNQDIGDFTVDTNTLENHCFAYRNIFNQDDSTTTVQGQTFNQVGRYMYESYNLQSWSNVTGNNAFMLIQQTGEQTFTVNGNNTTNPGSNHVSLTDVANTLFTDVLANDIIAGQLADLTINFSVLSGFSVDYSVSNGVTTHTGTIGAGW